MTRMYNKQRFYEKYIELKEQLEHNEYTANIENDLEQEMNYYYNQSIYITKAETKEVQKLLDLYGMHYENAKNEADHYCSELVQKGIAYGVLSDDSDMFALGCKKVFRFLDVLNHTIIMYDVETLYQELDMNPETFKWLCMISKNDYRCQKSDDTIDEIYEQLKLLPKELRNIESYGQELDENDCKNINNITKIYKNKGFNKNILMYYLESHGFIH